MTKPNTDDTSKRIEGILENFDTWCLCDKAECVKSRNYERAKSLIMELVNEARIEEVKRPISEYHEAELEGRGRGYNFYFALRTRLDQLHNKKSPTITKKGK